MVTPPSLCLLLNPLEEVSCLQGTGPLCRVSGCLGPLASCLAPGSEKGTLGWHVKMNGLLSESPQAGCWWSHGCPACAAEARGEKPQAREILRKSLICPTESLRPALRGNQKQRGDQTLERSRWRWSDVGIGRKSPRGCHSRMTSWKGQLCVSPSLRQKGVQ